MKIKCADILSHLLSELEREGQDERLDRKGVMILIWLGFLFR